jgi:hypothetical protein
LTAVVIPLAWVVDEDDDECTVAAVNTTNAPHPAKLRAELNTKHQAKTSFMVCCCVVLVDSSRFSIAA